MATKTIDCFGYVRVSTDNQLENYSIEEQTERLKAYCRAKGYTLVRIYTDGGYSGGNTNRPALKQMLQAIRNESVDLIVVYKLDRLSRSQKDTLSLIEDVFLANNVDFVSINENFDTSSAFGRAMIGILSVFAQLEKEQITERFTMGRMGRAKKGLFHGGAYAPVGYDYLEGKLLVNEYEALQVLDLFTRITKGYSIHSCNMYMGKYATKYGTWNETLIRKALRNRVYIGDVQFKDVYYKGIHKPIVPPELFNEVQDILKHSKQNRSSYNRSPFRASTLLSGLVYCGNCGAKFHGEHGNYSCYSRTKGDSKYIKDPNCKNKKWKIAQLDSIVIKHMADITFDEYENDTKTAPITRDYRKRLAEIEKQISHLIDLYQVGTIPIETISKKIDFLTLEKDTLSEAAKDNSTKQLTNTEKLQFRERFLSLLENGSLEEKRACLANLIDKITIIDESVEISLQ